MKSNRNIRYNCNNTADFELQEFHPELFEAFEEGQEQYLTSETFFENEPFEFSQKLKYESDLEELAGDSRIIDLTAQADKTRRIRTRDPKKVHALVLHQMACCFKVVDPLKRFLKMAPHFAILPDGRILQLHPILSLTGASNDFNPGSVAVEFAGNFPNTKGKWWISKKELANIKKRFAALPEAQIKARIDAYIKANQNRVTPEQIEAGRYLVRYLIRTMGLKTILAHRQSSGDRENDPGPDIWYHVGQWAIDNLGLKDGGPGFKVGTGNPIPDLWRKWGQAKPQPELEAELEAPVGTCPTTPVPASRRPRVLMRGSKHSAVREAQRKLNAFHRYRLTAGLSALRNAPLVEDCVFGKNTYESVKSFQELVFPGMSVEHDGKIGTKTWAQLDAIAMGMGTSPAAQLTVEQPIIRDDGFATTLTWDNVIGLNTASLNVEFVAWGLPPATMPPHITVELSSRSPNRAGGVSTLGAPLKLTAARFRPETANPNRIIYRLSHPLSALGEFLKVERRIKEVATVVRNGGTSDAEFRKALRWNARGIATQPTAVGASTGSESGEIPDAFALFRSAGAEVLDLKVPAQPNWRVPGAVKRLVRSPADVLYYSGHGLSKSGKLGIDIESKPCGSHGTYHGWLGPTDLTAAWTSPMDLDVLILAGCSVLKIDFSTSPASGPGIDWSGLLRAKGGPLVALLGYRDRAPCDTPNGDAIARQMAQRLAKGSTNFARDWLEVNGNNNADNAVAMDDRGYWRIESTFFGGFEIKGPTPIP